MLALLGPEGATDGALARALGASAVARTLEHPGVLRLVGIESVDSRIAWCYEPFEGLGLVHLVGSDGQAEMPARAAAELVAQVAEVLLALGAVGLLHPGPEPADLILAPSGTAKVTGFSGPYPASPAMRAPAASSSSEAATVYRLGVLLAHLTSGSALPASSDAEAHGIAVRRALIRAMARPGPILSERYGQWIRGMLAWSPAERPPLSSVPAGLRAVAWATGGESLVDWSSKRVPDLVRAVERRGAGISDSTLTPVDSEAGDSPPLDEGPGSRDPFAPSADSPIFEDDSSTAAEDENTQETFDVAMPGLGPGGATPRAAMGGMPVDIGPPAAAIKRPTLPPGFLGDETSGATSDTESSFAAATSPPVLIGVIIGLLIAVLLLIAYILFGDRSPPVLVPDGPGLNEAVRAEPVPGDLTETEEDLPEPDVPPVVLPEQSSGQVDSADSRSAGEPVLLGFRAGSGPHTVRFRLAAGLSGEVEVRCAGMPAAARAPSEVLVKGLAEGQECEISGWVEGRDRPLRHQTTVEGPATIDCFHDLKGGCLD